MNIDGLINQKVLVRSTRFDRPETTQGTIRGAFMPVKDAWLTLVIEIAETSRLEIFSMGGGYSFEMIALWQKLS